jgi:nucleotide-binding universal stress UspA family protein
MRFAIQWSRQQKAKLLFLHVAYIPGLTRWSDKQYRLFVRSELERRQRKLEQLVSEIYAQMGIREPQYECRVIEGISPDITLVDYCQRHKDINVICMGTHGAVGLQRLWGTHAGNMVTHSATPVVVVPKGYRAKPISRVLYATDLSHFEEELKKIAPLTRSFKAELDVLHLVGVDELVPNKVLLEKMLRQEFRNNIHTHIERMDETRSVAVNLQKQMDRIRPSLVVLFTDQQRTLFEKIFFPSKTERFAFRTHTPLLVFPKQILHMKRAG